MSDPVVITGLGVVAPLGASLPIFKQRLLQGESALARLSFARGDVSISFPAAPVADFKPEAYFEPKKVTFFDRFSQFAVVAAREAWANAGIVAGSFDPLRAAVIFGSGAGGMNTMEEQFERLGSNAITAKLHPFTVPRFMINAASSQISMDLGLMGPNFTVASACASATHAIGVAYQMVKSGQVDIAVTGGSEACLNLGTLKSWEALRVMAPDVCRPFAHGRQGMVLGEGSGAVVLEKLSHARKRGAKILAVLRGFGMSADARDLTSPDVDGMKRAIHNALSDAALKAADIDHINAHGTGTRANDMTESKALNDVFGQRLQEIPLTANKSLFGHALGAAGALEVVVAALTLSENTIPPTAHYQAPDPDCAVQVVTAPTARRVNHIMKNSFAFGGLNAVLIVSRFEA